MSEAPSHPHEPDSPVTVRPEGVADAPAPPDVPTLEAPQLYRPLSLLAVFSLVLGVAYALLVLVGGLVPFARVTPKRFVVFLLLGPVLAGLGAVLARQKSAERIAAIAAAGLVGVLVLMGLGGLIAFSGSSPWEPGLWSWALLFAALLTSVFALAQIRSSEGALAGRTLARCGLYLSLGFGGFYLLYLGANQFAVSNQAQAATDRFLDLIREDRLPEAYVLTLKPSSRPLPHSDDPDERSRELRREIEAGFNVPRSGESGEYTSFCSSALVQGLRQGGKGAKVVCLGAAPEFTPTGYVATVRYRVDNDLGRYEIHVVAQSVDVSGRREWQVNYAACRLTPVEASPLMDQTHAAVREADQFANRWLAELEAGRPEAAYLLTLPADERPPPPASALSLRPGPSPFARPSPSRVLEAINKQREAQRQRAKDFMKIEGKYAGFVDDRDFFADPAVRAKQKQEVISYFSPSNRSRVLHASLLRVDFPEVTREGDEYVVHRPVRFMIPPLGDEPGTLVEGEILCRGKPGGEAPLLERYRVVGLKLIRSAIAGHGGPGGPQKMNQRRP